MKGIDVDDFMTPDFDVEGCSRSIMERGETVNEILSSLHVNMEHLDKQLREQISSHHGKLLNQATSIESAEDLLDMLRGHVSALQSSADRVKNRMDELYNKAETRTRQLERLHTTCNLLRSSMRIMSLKGKLDVLMARAKEDGMPIAGETATVASKDLAKAASIIQEMTEIVEEVDLRGLNIIEQDLAAIPKARKDILAQARRLLMEGLKAPNQAFVGMALQALHNCRCLPAQLDRLQDGWIGEVEDAVGALSKPAKKSAMTVSASSPQITMQSLPPLGGSGPGGASVPPTVSSAAQRANLWSGVDKLTELLVSICSQCDVLCMVLARKKDPESHRAYSLEYPMERLNKFWLRLAEHLRKKLGESASYVKHSLETEYPKLLHQISDVWRRLERTIAVEDADGAKAVNRNAEIVAAMRGSLGDLENAYLSKSVSRLFDGLNLVFSEDKAPSTNEIATIVGSIRNELHVASFDAILFARVAKNIIKAINMFSVKSEALLITDGEASQVVGNVSPAQRKNAMMVCALSDFRIQILTALSQFDGLPEDALDGLIKSSDGVLQVMSNAVTPLLTSMLEAVSAIIASMHQEDFSAPIPERDLPAERQCSLYMRELQGFVARVWEEHFALPYGQVREFIFDHTTVLARKTVDLFINHAVLVRPLGEGGRLRLAADFAQMELALSPLCRKLSDIGTSYVRLRSVRPLFFEGAEAIAGNPEIGHSVPFSVALHLLISMSDSSLQSPHVTAGWSISRYSEWLEKHTGEKERLQFLRGTLEAYARSVQASGAREYVATYPLLLGLLKRGVESASPQQELSYFQ